jgi:hypothetical protein
MAIESTPSFVPMTTVQFNGLSTQNGKVVNRSNAGYKNIGGFIDVNDSNNSGLTANFGYVVSRSTSAASGLFALGVPSGYVPSGIIQYDAGVAQNSPAHSDYELQDTPVTIVYSGSVQYQAWGTTQSGHAVGAVLLTDVAIYKTTTGAVEFLASGTAIPSGWAQLPGKIIEVSEYGYVTLEIDFGQPPVVTSGFVTTGNYVGVTTAGLTAMGGTTTGYADDTAAATGGVPIGGFYHTSGAVKVRRT